MSEQRIDIKAKLKPIIKFGFVFQGLLILLFCPAFIFIAINSLDNVPFLAIIMLAAFVLFFLIAKKYLDNVFYKEYILLNTSSLTIVYKTLFKTTEHTFNVNEIQYLGFAGEHDYTRHPMDNDVVDFTGLGTTERELQFIIADGTIEIETEDETLRFGKNIPSWDAEHILVKIEEQLGVKFKTKYPAANEVD